MADFDVIVVGAGLGGVAAALAVADAGRTVLLVEASQWLGGQLTGQGVCTPDEDPLNKQPVVETCGSTRSYQDLKHRIRLWYRQNTRLSAKGEAENPLNIGVCWVNLGFASEPAVSVRVLEDMIGQRAGLAVWMNAAVLSAQVNGSVVASLEVQLADGSRETVRAGIVLDATETGELLPMLGLNWTIGAESKAQTTEPDAADDPHPEWIQSITIPFALIHRPKGEDHRIAKPDNYEAIKAAQNFTLVDGSIKTMFSGSPPFWTYRRVIDATLFNDPAYVFDVATINVGANDFKGAVYPSGDPATDAQVIEAARQVSLAFTYWLQNEAPRDEGGFGYPELAPATNFFGPDRFLAPLPYVRESRRIKASVTILQQDIDADYNPGPRAKLFPDSCGIGNYKMDVHSGPNGAPPLWKSTRPYQIPAGALIPQDCDNLLAACKNIGTTHISNGAYRLHPQEWNIGEAAGTLAAMCVETGQRPRDVVGDPDQLTAYQRRLLARGIPLYWWTDITPADPDFAAIQLMGVKGIFSGEAGTTDFRPDDLVNAATQTALQAKIGKPVAWPGGNVSRRVAANLIAAALG